MLRSMESPENCKNCNHTLSPSENYCSICGQKADAHVLSVKELLSNFWSSVFNFDNTLFKTLKYIWAPWKLTKFYVEGKRKAFLNPMRLFIVTVLFHFGFLVSLTNLDNNKTRSFREYSELERSKLYEKFLAVKKDIKVDGQVKTFSDSLETKLFDNITTPDKDTFRVEHVFNIKEFPITRKDAIELPMDSIYSKYNVHTFIDKIKVKQLIKMNLDRAGTLKYALGNAAWGLLITVVLLGFLFKILYFRKKLPYVEHLVFWMNVHSFSFFMVTVVLFLILVVPSTETQDNTLTIFISIFLPSFVYLSMYNYYKQGKIKTLIKFLITGVFYLMMGMLVMVLVSLASLLFF